MMTIFFKFDKLCVLLAACSFLLTTHINAQHKSTTGLSPEVMAWTVSTMEPWPPGKYKSVVEAMMDNKIFPPLVFRGGLFPKFIDTYSRDSLRLINTAPLPPAFDYKTKIVSPLFEHYLFLKSFNDMAYKKILETPSVFKFTIWQLPTTIIKPESIDKTKEQVKIEMITAAPPEKVDPVLKFIPDRKYWTSTFAADIKFSQNKSSINWRPGPINNMNIYTNTVTTYNYARNKVSLTNVLTTIFTINNVQNDTLRKYAIGSDELRFRSNLGLVAIKHWNYSSSAELVTAMGNRYIGNTKIKNVAFLSPFTINVGMGMTYAVAPPFKKPNRSLSLSISLEPLSFRYMYSIDKDINLPAHGFQVKEISEEGIPTYERVLKTFGSKINMSQTSKIGKYVTLYTRFAYFTNYESVTSELENKLDIYINKYFSTTLHIFMRYDDLVPKLEGSDTLVQVNEVFSFGFAYRW